MTELPDGWADERFGDVLNVRYGKALEKSLRIEGGPVPVVGSAGTMTGTTKPLVETPCIVIGRKGNVGEARFYADGCWPIDTTYFVEIPETFVGRYLELELERLDLRSLDSSTTTPSLRRQDLDEVRLCRPSRGEQLQIVRILDTQLARLDTVLAAVQAVRDKADQFRRSLLHAAFTGQLTQPDPRRTTDLPAGWDTVQLDDVADVQLGRQRSPKNVDGPFQRHYLRAANVTWSGLDISELKQMNFTEEEMSTYRLQPGDILVNEASGSASEVGKPALFSGEVDDCAFQNHLIRLRCHSIETNFLLHFLMKTAVNGEYVRRSQGVGINHLGKKTLAAWPVPKPPAAEQEEIVQILDTQIERLNKALEVADQVEAECGRLRRSLLQAAFTGELTRKWREANV